VAHIRVGEELERAPVAKDGQPYQKSTVPHSGTVEPTLAEQVGSAQRGGRVLWLPWLDREFGWTEMTATRFMNVYELGKSNNLLDLSIPISGLYLLAAPSTPEAAPALASAREPRGPAVKVSC
jgi:hypothetical protein